MYPEFNRILVPIDLSPTSMLAYDHAVFLAQHLKSDLHLIHIKETATVNNLLKGVFKKDDPEAVKDLSLIEKRFAEFKADLESKYSMKVFTKIVEGTVYTQVLNYAKEISASLICIGTHGSKGVENFIGGSNTFRVVNNAKCPVLSIHSNSGSKGIKDIVLPLDSSRDTREKVDDAIYIAKKFNSTIHIVGVSTSSDAQVLNRLKVVTNQVVEYIQKDEIKTTNSFVTGKNLATITLEYAKEKNADLIVIMTEQESSSGFLAGPYSQQMINQSAVPILSVRPKERETEFVTPY